MRVAIHQPQCWPWPRYIHKVMSADLFVYLDTVQFTRNGRQNRNQVKGPSGALWLTVPVRHRLGQRIFEVEIAQRHRLRKHLHALAQSYGRTEGYRQWAGELDDLMRTGSSSLCELAIATTEWILRKLSVTTSRVRASELRCADAHGSDATGSRLVAELCAKLGARQYLSGSGATEYMSRADFDVSRCDVLLQQWNKLNYTQVFPGAGFIPDLSTLDLLLTHPRDARQLIEHAGSWRSMWTAQADKSMG